MTHHRLPLLTIWLPPKKPPNNNNNIIVIKIKMIKGYLNSLPKLSRN